MGQWKGRKVRDRGVQISPDRVAYKRYTIVRFLAGNGFAITKDGHNISSATSIEAAHNIIDALTDGVKENPGNRSEVRSPTSTRTEVRSPTSTRTATRAHTQGNVTVTGGAGDGNTSVTLRRNPRTGRVDRDEMTGWVVFSDFNNRESYTPFRSKAEAEKHLADYMRKQPKASAWILAPLRKKKNPSSPAVRRGKNLIRTRIGKLVFVQYEGINSSGKKTGWITLLSFTDNPAGIAKAKRYASLHSRLSKMRVIRR